MPTTWNETPVPEDDPLFSEGASFLVKADQVWQRVSDVVPNHEELGEDDVTDG